MKDGWEIKKLGEVCTIKGRIGFRGYTRDDLVAKGEGAITLSPSNIINDVLSFDKCQYISWFKYEESPEIQIFNGDIIYAKTASIGKVALVKDLPEKATINPQFVVFKDIKCYSPYLYYAVKSENFKLQISLITNGVAIPTVSQNNMANLSIPIPPLPTQERIVSELDCINSIIEKKREQLKELDALAQSIFYDMFGDPIHNEKGWEVRKLGEVAPAKEFKGIVPSIDGKYWLLNLDMVVAHSGEIVEQCYFEPNEIGNSTIVFSTDNVLYSKLRPYLNKVVVPYDIGYATSELVPLCPNKDMLDRIYLAHVLRSTSFVEYISEKVAGAKMPRVSMSEFRAFPLPLPPLPLQQSFASKIEVIEKQKEVIKRSIAETETLLASRMQHYFG